MNHAVAYIAGKASSQDTLPDATWKSTNDVDDHVGNYVDDEEQENKRKLILDQEFSALRQSAQSAAGQMLQGNRVYYGHLVDLMLFWHAAKDSDYIKQLIKKKASKTYKKKVSHGHNFAPLIDVIWAGINVPDFPSNKSNRISRALNRLYEAFTTQFGADASRRDDLIDYMVEKGGVNGLVSYDNELANSGEETPDIKVDKDAARRVAELRRLYAAQVYAKSVTFFRDNSQGLPAVQLPIVLPTSEDDLALVLVSKSSNGSHVIIDSITDGEQIKRSVTRRYLGQYEALPRALRFVVEALSTQVCSADDAETHIRLLNEAARVAGDRGRKAVRRLTYRHAKGDFLLSNILGTGGLVTIAKPKVEVIESPFDDVALGSPSRRGLEKSLIGPKGFRLIQFNPLLSTGPIPSTSGRAITNSTNIKVPVVGVDEEETNILVYFHREDRKRRRQMQVDVVDGGTVKPHWSRTVDRTWFKSFNAAFTNNWVNSHARHVNRPHQSVVDIHFGSIFLQVNFFNLKGESDLSTNVEVPIGAIAGGTRRSFLSRDFAIAMLQVADLPIIGDVAIELYKSYLKIAYETEVGSYRIYIPTSTSNGDVLDEGFTSYEMEHQLSHEDMLDDLAASEEEGEIE